MSLSLSGVQFSYSDAPFRLEVPALQVAAGERVALVGPSGAGKSTLLALMSGLVLPQTGEVETLGVRLARAPEPARRQLRLRMGLVFQEQDLVAHLSMIDNVLLPLYLSRDPPFDEARARGASLLRRLGLDAGVTRPSVHLSRGEKERVALARALVHRPTLILADEPTASLDAKNAERVWSLIFDCCEETAATLVASTHDPEVLARFGRTVDVAELAGVGA